MTRCRRSQCDVKEGQISLTYKGGEGVKCELGFAWYVGWEIGFIGWDWDTDSKTICTQSKVYKNEISLPGKLKFSQI